MYKGLAVSIALLFSLSTGAFGTIGQSEGFNISAENQVFLSGSPGLASGGNSAIIGQSQAIATSGFDLIIAVQNEVGILNQVTSAVGLSAAINGTQEAGLIGQQIQTAGSESSNQEQNQAVNLAQDVNKNGGTGGVIAGQGVIVGQIQIVANSKGFSGDAQFTGVSQFNGISGGPGSNIIVNNDSAIGTGQ